jgi:hypothetical protein
MSSFKLLRLATSTRIGNRSARYCVIRTYSNRPTGLLVELDQNTDIARVLCLTTRDGAEQGRVTNPASVQLRLVNSQFCDDLFPIDAILRACLTDLVHPPAQPSVACLF